MFRALLAALAAVILCALIWAVFHSPFVVARPWLAYVLFATMLIVTFLRLLKPEVRRHLLARCLFLMGLGILATGCTTAGSQAVAPITSAVAQGLPHCTIDGSFNAGAGGLAGTGTGVANNFTFHCPGQPWAAPVAVAGAVSVPGGAQAPAVTTPPAQ